MNDEILEFLLNLNILNGVSTANNSISLSVVSSEIGTINLYTLVITLSAGSLSAANPEAGWSITFTDEEIETEVTAISGSISDDTITLVLDESILPFTTITVSYSGGDLLQDGTPVAAIAEFEADNNYLWEIYDDFDNGNLAEGEVDGTDASKVGTRIDIYDNLEITDDGLYISSDGLSSDNFYFDEAITRSDGRLLVAKVTALSVAEDFIYITIGFSGGKGGIPQRASVQIGNGPLYFRVAVANILVGSTGSSTEVYLAFILREAGGYYGFVNYDGNWKLLLVAAAGALSTLYAGILSLSTPDAYVRFMRVTASPVLPTPLAYDTFASPVTTAADNGSNGLDGTFVNCGLGGANGAFFNGATSYVNIYSASLNSLFDGKEFGVVIRAKVSDANVWADLSKVRYLAYLYTGSASNRIYLIKTNAAINTLRCAYIAGGSTKFQDVSASTTDFFGIGLNASKIDDKFKVFFNGSQSGSTLTTLGTYTGSLISRYCNIGVSDNVTLPDVWPGWIKDVVITLNGVVPTDTQMQYLTDTANTITTAYLDAQFGSGNYIWYKLDEQNQTLSLGPESQATTPLSWDTSTGSIVSGELANTPILGNELLANPGNPFTFTSDNPNGFAVTGESGSDPEVSEVGVGEGHGGTGSNYLNMYSTSAVIIISNTTLTAWKWYRLVFVVDTVVSGSIGPNNDISFPNITSTGTKTSTGLASGTGYGIKRIGSCDITLESLSVKQISLASCMAALAVADSAPYAQAAFTITADTQSMLWIGLDDETNPQNGIVIVLNRVDTKIYVYKVDAGVWTSQGSTAFTYSAGAILAVRRLASDDSLYVWYNGAYIASYTVTLPVGAGTKVGFLQLDEASRIDNVQVMSTTDYDDLLNPYALEGA